MTKKSSHPCKTSKRTRKMISSGNNYHIDISIVVLLHWLRSTYGTKNRQITNLDSSLALLQLAQLSFADNQVYHIKNVAYDLYSIHGLAEGRTGRQWLTFPLPEELNDPDYPIPWHPSINSVPKQNSHNTWEDICAEDSPSKRTGIAYIKQIYVISDVSFIDRHEQLKKTFRQHSIPTDSINWRWKWNRTTCSSIENQAEVNRKLNIKSSVSFSFFVQKLMYLSLR